MSGAEDWPGKIDKYELERLDREKHPPAPDQLSQPFGNYQPDVMRISQLSADDLIGRYDGTIVNGTFAVRADISETGERPTRFWRRGVATLGHETPDLVKAPDTAGPEKAGRWTHYVLAPNLPPTYSYSSLSVEDQQRLDAIADQIHREWQEWKGTGSQHDFRTWVGQKRVTQLHQQQPARPK